MPGLFLVACWGLLERGFFMYVRVLARRPDFFRFTKHFVMVAAAFVCSVAVVSAGDDGAFFFLMNSAGASIGEATAKFLMGSDSAVNPKNGTTKTVVVEEGVNLSLIDKIKVTSPRNGYIKELLSFMRDAQNGKISGKDEGNPLVCSLGVHANEVGVDNSGCPDFYFSADSWKEGDSSHSFAGFTSRSNKSRSIDGSGGSGTMQWIHSESGFGYKSVIDPVGNSRQYPQGDLRFYPDALAYLDDCYYNKEKEYKGASKVGIATLGGMSNNRGDAGVTYLMSGIAYANHGTGVRFHWGNMTARLKKKKLDWLFGSLTSCLSDDNFALELGNGQRYCMAVAVLMNCKDEKKWFINRTAYQFLIGHGYVGIYKQLYGRKSMSDSQIKDELDAHVSGSLADSISKINSVHVTSRNTQIAYGTGSDYQDCPYYSGGGGPREYGYVWYVSDVKDADGVYTGSGGYENPFHVIGFDGVSLRYSFDTSVVGYYEYARLLKLAGVNGVDPTNPQTYMEQIKVVQVNKSTGTNDGTWTGELDSYLSNMHIDTSLLTEDRIVILNIAAEICQRDDYGYSKPYRSGTVKAETGYADGSHTGYKLDCSSFCAFVYQHAGFSDMNTGMTTESFYNRTMFKKISFNELKPGDFIWHRVGQNGHIELFLGGSSWSSLYEMGAHGKDSFTHKDSISAHGPKSRVGYTALRYYKIDKGKRGKTIPLPKKLGKSK